MLGIPGYHVHELVEIVEVQHGLEYERAKVTADLVQAGGCSHMIQNVLPAAIVIELAPCESGVLQGEGGPHILQFEGAIPGSAYQRRIVALTDRQVREYLLQQNVRRLVPRAVLLAQLILL